MKMKILLFLSSLGSNLMDGGLVAGQSFLNLSMISSRRVAYPGCLQANTESCMKAVLDLHILQTEASIELPDGTLLELSDREDNSAIFKSVDAEAVFTWQGQDVAGSVHVAGWSWTLEGCGEECFLWIKQTSSWMDEKTRSSSSRRLSTHQPPTNLSFLKDQGETDRTTMVTYSVMIWYTPQFRGIFSSNGKMMAFVRLIFRETNEGYINSNIPLRVVMLDIQPHPTLNDIYDSNTMLDSFAASMPMADLLNSADSSALLIEDFDSCGISYLGGVLNCEALSVTTKSCATGYYSFGHEISHNFGAHHNPEEDPTPGDAHAHLILPTSPNDYSGYRTILAYHANGHRFRKNYYSNPNVLFSTTNTATGVISVSNNARVITANRFAMASCGNEHSITETTSAATTISSTTVTSTNFTIELRGGSVPSQGNLFVNEKPVCDDFWDISDAVVACRMLGYPSGSATIESQFGSVPSVFIFDDVNCNGNEDSLFECSYNPNDNCRSNEGAGVICQESTTLATTTEQTTDTPVTTEPTTTSEPGVNNMITLQGGSVPSEGNVFVNGKPVCDDGWDTNEAAVACRMLGYPFGSPTTRSRFGMVPDVFIFDDVNCDGSEETLFDCSYKSIDNCESTEGAGVICLATTTVAIELRGGSVPSEGNLFVNDKPVCDDSWDISDAMVACRMLGYPSGSATIESQFGSVPSVFIFDDVNCNGYEESLFECSYNPNDNCR
eukprot:GFUD01033395.1.p1 GENE.GFUD01033395.1~~GFUD01033395.1.p1  ORF type:complete len:725 (+),score=108.76 GFUD01033395.1:33-2207(+)